MKKWLLLLLLLPLTAQAQVIRRRVEGSTVSTSVTQQTQALNTATTYVAYSVQQKGTKNWSTLEVRVSAVAGTLTNISCELQADTNGAPSGTSLETVTATTGLPTGAGNFTFTAAGTTSMTDGNFYWFVIKNNTATPATNNFTLQWVTGAIGAGHASTGGFGGFSKALTTDGTTWGTYVANVTGFLVGYADTTYDGIASNLYTQDTTNKAYDTHEVGVQFTTPAFVKYNLRGVAIAVRKNGTPTGNLTAKIYTGSSPMLLATSLTSFTPAQISATGNIGIFLFAGAQAISPSTIVTITLKDNAADTSANYYTIQGWSLMDTSAGSLSTLPDQGTRVEAIFDGAAWSTSTTIIPQVNLLLDEGSPYLARVAPFVQQVSFRGKIKLSGKYRGAGRDVLFSDDFETGVLVPPWTTENDDTIGFAVNNNTVRPHAGSRSVEIHYDICRLTGTPVAPTLSTVACGGTGGNRFVQYTYWQPNTSGGVHRTISAEASTTVASGNCLKVTSPAAATGIHHWYVWVSTTTGTETIQNGSTAINLGTDWTEPGTGLVAGATPAQTACPTGNQDDNRWLKKTLSTPPTDFYVRSYVYQATPQNGGAANGVQRKLYWFQDSTAAWSFGLTTDASGGAMPMRFFTNGSVPCTVSAANDASAMGSLNYDTWYSLEMRVHLNTPGLSDGSWTLWVNGVQDSSESNWNLRGTCSTGAEISIGRQANDASGLLAVDELRYWDDVQVATSYIGP